jgi:hypothetical protein
MYRFLFNITASVVVFFSFLACSNSEDNSYTNVAETRSGQSLFDLSCSSSTSCTQTANTYLVQVDGLYIEPNQEFIDKCLTDRAINAPISIYCKQMILPGDSESFNASAKVIEHLKENGFNPTDDDVSRRIKIAEDKIYSNQ